MVAAAEQALRTRPDLWLLDASEPQPGDRHIAQTLNAARQRR
jgi:hypothetical protein